MIVEVKKYKALVNEVEAINYASEDHRKAIIEWSDCRHSGIDDDGADFETLLLFLPDNRGGEIRLYPGEWAVKNADGRFFALSDAEFLRNYQPLSQPVNHVIGETLRMVVVRADLDRARESAVNAQVAARRDWTNNAQDERPVSQAMREAWQDAFAAALGLEITEDGEKGMGDD